MVKGITKLLVQNLDEGSKTIGGAGSIADNGLIRAVVVSVNSNNISRNVTLSRGSDKHFFGSCLYVLTCTISIDKHTCSFNYKVYP